MNTHDKIELPPLPRPDAEFGTHSRKQIREYTRAAIEPYQKRIEELEAELQELQRQWVEHDTLGCPTAKTGIYAIEADRQRRGEPVGMFTGRFVMEPDGSNALFVVQAYGAIPPPGVELFADPQPAAPDYKQLFEQMCERCDALDAKLAEYSEREPVARVNDDGFIVETGLGLAPGTLLYTAPQPAELEKEPPCET